MRNVLVVDDDPSILTFIKGFLEKENYSVQTYTEAREALDALKVGQYRAVISDLNMPVMNGEEFYKKCKEISPNIPFIFLTGNKKFETVKEIMKMGADDYWVKPINPRFIGDRLEKILYEKDSELTVRETQLDRLLEERDKKRLVSWKNLYGMKEVEQTNQMMSFLSRNIEQAGNFMWLDMLTNMLKESPKESQEISLNRTMLELIVESTEYIKKILDDLKYVTTLQEDTILLEYSALENTISDIKEYYESELLPAVIKHNKRLQLDIIKRDSDKSIEVNIDLLKKILMELLFNSIKYSPVESKIIIYLDIVNIKEKEYFEISFWNQPMTNDKEIIGIPYELSESVFDLFYTIDDIPVRIKEEEWSQGSGLYIVRKLLQKMNSYINCKNVVMHSFSEKRVYVKTTINIPLT